MQKQFYLLALGALMLAACDSQPANTYKPAPVIGGQENTNGDAPVMMPEQAAPAPQPAASNTSTALNPEHGQPGHRCDIPVGAPLNSPAGSPQEISTQLNTGPNQNAAPVESKVTEEKPAPAPKTSGKRLNPEHGQPGHDCAVPVGSPLP